ncbi:MAG TPA: hypothetical protein VEA59_02355 [Patescibacteria group bacterium]|nr:hypothetical protein [Patescibacteria group bacterium]
MDKQIFQENVNRENSQAVEPNAIKQDKSGLKIGVIGGGFVGGSVAHFFKVNNADVKVYDKYKPLDTLEEALAQDFLFIAVPTPSTVASPGSAGAAVHYSGDKIDLSYMDDAMANAAKSKAKAVIIKSTVIPGTTDAYQKQYPHLKILFNPEFLTERTAQTDFLYPDRQIIGYTDQSFDISGVILGLLPLAPFSKVITAAAAEMVKYFGNTWFSTKVVFANQMYDLCEKLGIDYYEVADSAGADRRIGRSHLDVMHGGFRGYGGKCLPKDTRALIAFGKEHGVEMDLLQSVEKINGKLTGGIDR